MKTIISTIALLAVFFTVGCSTLQNQSRTERFANTLESVAFVGTVNVIKNNPEVRVIFQEVEEELAEQQDRGSLTYETLVSILRKLPIDELKGEEGLLYVEGGRILFDPGGDRELDLGAPGQNLLMLAGGIRRGIERGLAW